MSDAIIRTERLTKEYELGQLTRRVAVKLLHPHLAADEQFVARFKREAVAAAERSGVPLRIAGDGPAMPAQVERIVLARAQ